MASSFGGALGLAAIEAEAIEKAKDDAETRLQV